MLSLLYVVCFYVFDQDKHGFFDTAELKLLMNILHKVPTGETVRGNIKVSWQNLRFSEDDRVEFEELKGYHEKFPRLFAPAFRLQIQMMLYIKGNAWWNKKKGKIRKMQEAEKLTKLKDKAAIEYKQLRAQTRKTRKKMGLFRYYFCPCLRKLFEAPIQPLVDPAAEEAQRQKALAIAEARRQHELKLKNPETHAWKNYQIKKQTEENRVVASGTVQVLREEDKIQRKRNERALNREERRERRKENMAEL